MNVSLKILPLALPFLMFLFSGIIWFLILIQVISFIWGFVVLSFLVFVVFWRSLLIIRRAGEVFILRNKKQVLIVSLVLTLGFSELIWALSFLPFSFFVLAGLFSVIFAVVFDVFKEYFKQRPDLFSESDQGNLKKVLIRDILSGIIFIIIIIGASSWLPIKVH